MTTDTAAAPENIHEQSDTLRIWGDAFFQRMSREFQEKMQGMANYEAMYAEQKQLADKWRERASNQRAAIDQAISNLRGMRAMNDDGHIDEMITVTADLLFAVLHTQEPPPARHDDTPCLCCQESGCQFGCSCLTEGMRAALVGPYYDGIDPADLAGGDGA